MCLSHTRHEPGSKYRDRRGITRQLYMSAQSGISLHVSVFFVGSVGSEMLVDIYTIDRDLRPTEERVDADVSLQAQHRASDVLEADRVRN